MFERNDVLFSDVAERFGVKESVVESLVLGMLWAGERAMGRDEVRMTTTNPAVATHTM